MRPPYWHGSPQQDAWGVEREQYGEQQREEEHGQPAARYGMQLADAPEPAIHRSSTTHYTVQASAARRYPTAAEVATLHRDQDRLQRLGVDFAAMSSVLLMLGSCALIVMCAAKGYTRERRHFPAAPAGGGAVAYATLPPSLPDMCA
jgi:hypothetical protein